MPKQIPRMAELFPFRFRRRRAGTALSALLVIGLFLASGCDQPYSPDPEGLPAFSGEEAETGGQTDAGEEPGNPDESGAGDKPEARDESGNEDRNEPETGDEPDAPDKPDAAGEPGGEDEPDTADKPEVMDESGAGDGDEPDAPDKPEVMDESGAGDGEEPETADEPEAVDKPEAVDEPGDEDEPDTVDKPEVMDEPGAGDGEEPGAADEPDAPDEPVRVSIKIQKPPEKPAYAKGEDLDTAGLEVLGVYSDGSSRLEDLEALQFSGYDKTKSGDQVVTVTLEGKTAEFTVRVSLNRLTLNITRYQEGEMNILGIPEGEILLFRSGADGQAHELILQVEGYEQVWCFVNGMELSPSEAGFTVQALDYSGGHHVITLIGVKDGVPSGRELSFIVFE